ncbi:MAG: hypothetical protein PVJ82_10090 [Desulfobacteraceae bacterium]
MKLEGWTNRQLFPQKGASYIWIHVKKAQESQRENNSKNFLKSVIISQYSRHGLEE